MKRQAVGVIVLCALAAVGRSGIVSRADDRPAPKPIEPAVSAQDLLRKAVEHQLTEDRTNRTRWMFRSTIQSDGHILTREVIETNDGNIHRLLAVDGHPLDESQRKAETARLSKFVSDKSAWEKQAKEQEKDNRESESFLSELPKALVARYGQRRVGEAELLLDPKPSFRPISHEQQVIAALAGDMWVNTQQNALVKVDGHLSHEVKFWGGLLGWLDKGGIFEVDQKEVAPGIWKIDKMHVNMTGKALFFKNIGEHQDETHSDFQRVPENLTLAEAAERLDAFARTAAAQRDDQKHLRSAR